jgi:hypothetical protein
MLILVQYAVTCHTITVTNYRLTWCGVVINVIFNTCFSSIICYIGKFYFVDFLNCHFELYGENFTKIITIGHLSFELSMFSK